MTKIKLTTLNRDIQILIDKKIIVQTDTGKSTGGRKPSLYDVNPNEFCIIGYYKDKSIAVGACAIVIQKLQN